MRIFLTLITLFSFFQIFAQDCLPQGFNIVTQHDIDIFKINNPNCTKILGDITIRGNSSNPPWNFDSLHQIKTIGGDFIINQADRLTDFRGLENLERIEGNLVLTFSGFFPVSYTHLTLPTTPYV